MTLLSPLADLLTELFPKDSLSSTYTPVLASDMTQLTQRYCACRFDSVEKLSIGQMAKSLEIRQALHESAHVACVMN